MGTQDSSRQILKEIEKNSNILLDLEMQERRREVKQPRNEKVRSVAGNLQSEFGKILEYETQELLNTIRNAKFEKKSS